MGPIKAEIGYNQTSMLADSDGFEIEQKDGTVWLSWPELVEINRIALAMDQKVLPVELFGAALKIVKKIEAEKLAETTRLEMRRQ